MRYTYDNRNRLAQETKPNGSTLFLSMTMIIIAVAAFALGIFLPTPWGVFGFIAAVIGLFAAQAGIDISSGYGGMPIQDSLGLFGDFWASYIGFNLKLTYCAFALVLLALAVPFVFRLSKVARLVNNPSE